MRRTTLATLLLMAWLSLTFSGAAAATQQNETVAPQDDVASLIDQLGANEFDLRQQATAKLLKMGLAARAAIEQATRSSNLEIASRAQQLLELIRANPISQLTGGEARLWKEFHVAQANDRTRLFQEMIQSGQVDLVLAIASDYPAQKSFLFNSSSKQFHNLLASAFAQQRWDLVQPAIQHPLTRESSPADLYHYHYALGSLDAHVDQQFEVYQQAINDGHAPSQEQIGALLDVLRMSNQHSRAQIVSEWLKSEDLQSEYQKLLWLESGDWQQVLKLSGPPEQAQADKARLPILPAQRALLQFVSRNESGFKATIDELKQGLQTATKQQDQFGIDYHRGQLLMLGLVTLDWELVDRYLPEDSPEDAFDFLSYQRRYRRAFDSIGIGETPASGLDWVDQTIGKMQQLTEQINETEVAQRRTREYRNLLAERNLLRARIVDVADLLFSLGRDEEGRYSLNALILSEPESVPTLTTVLQLLVSHEQVEATWELLELCSPGQSPTYLAQQLFRDRLYMSDSIVNAYVERYPDPMQLLKVVSGLVNSPLGTIPEFNLDLELARFRGFHPLMGNVQTESVIMQLMDMHGLDERRDYWLGEAIKLGSSQAEIMRSMLQYIEGDLENSVVYHDRIWRSNRSVFNAMIAADIFQRLADQDPAESAEMADRVAEAKFGALSMWRSRSIGLTTVVANVQQYGCDSQLTWFLKSNVCGLGATREAAERYRPALIENLMSKDVQQYREAAIQSTIRLFNEMANNNVESLTLNQWVDNAQAMCLALSLAEFRAGDREAAEYWANRCVRFSPGDSAVAETLFQVFVPAGADGLVDRILDVQAEFFGQLLEQYPDSPLHRNNFAWTLVCARRNLEQARREVDHALRRRPKNSSYLDTKAEVEALLGNPQQALEYSRRSVQANPSRTYYRRQVHRFGSN